MIVAAARQIQNNKPIIERKTPWSVLKSPNLLKYHVESIYSQTSVLSPAISGTGHQMAMLHVCKIEAKSVDANQGSCDRNVQLIASIAK